MDVSTDNHSYEKILIFGGITNYRDSNVSGLTNQLFSVEIKQIM